MSNKKQRNKNRAEHRKIVSLVAPRPVCPNCHKEGMHFVPPSFGDKGGFICKEPPQ